VGRRLGLTTKTQISVCKSSFPSTGTAVPCENGSAETTVTEGGRNPVAGFRPPHHIIKQQTVKSLYMITLTL